MSETCQFLPQGKLSRIVILGAGDGVLIAARMARARGLAVQVVTSPRQVDTVLADGRDYRAALAELAIPLYVVDRLDQGPLAWAGAGVVAVSFGCPWILNRRFLDAYGGRVINSHGAPLPEWRGGGGWSWRIMAGDRRGRSLFHLVTTGIDDGDVILEREFTFPPAARTPRDWARIQSDHDARLIEELIDGLVAGRFFSRRCQDPAQATYFPRLNTDRQGWIDWTWPGSEIELFVLAFSHPYPGASTQWAGRRIRLFNARFQPRRETVHPFQIGLIIRVHDSRLTVLVDGGELVVDTEDIMVEGSGFPALGDRLHTPLLDLEAARCFRAIYTPSGLKGGG